MAETLRQLTGPGIAGNEDLPPKYVVKFTAEEFPAFVANPVGTMNDLGHPVERLHLSLSNSSWVPSEGKWIKNIDVVKAGLPTSSTWHWLCGYEDEMCVCYQVQNM